LGKKGILRDSYERGRSKRNGRWIRYPSFKRKMKEKRGISRGRSHRTGQAFTGRSTFSWRRFRIQIRMCEKEPKRKERRESIKADEEMGK